MEFISAIIAAVASFWFFSETGGDLTALIPEGVALPAALGPVVAEYPILGTLLGTTTDAVATTSPATASE